jgi:hypothetical protein
VAGFIQLFFPLNSMALSSAALSSAVYVLSYM